MMLMGSADPIIAAAPKVVFAEDLPDDERENALADLPPGLVNLENTCYFNATVQCLASVPELVEKLSSYNPSGSEPADTVASALRNTIQTLRHTKAPVIPSVLLNSFRNIFPNFAERRNGVFAQQDAEEAWTQLLWCLKRLPKISDKLAGDSAVDQLFQGQFETKYKCIESPDEPQDQKREDFTKLACHIRNETSFLAEGVKLSLNEEIEKVSPTLNRNAKYSKESRIAALPFYLTVQFVRFFFRGDIKAKVKIVKPMQYPFELDTYDFCSEELKKKLEPKRKELIEAREKDQLSNFKASQNGENDTGIYELSAIVTHKGQSAEGGHYVAWVRDDNTKDGWLCFDDDRVTQVTSEDVAKLDGKGGAQWHMAYITLYRPKKTWTK
jgi:ubiquitin carboxyl-terminal hydrolase 14